MSDNIDDMIIGNIVNFQSKNIIDDNKYYGTILGFLNYEIAKQYMDIEAYHNGVLLNYNDIGDKENLSYFLIKLSNQDITVCFSKEWILESTFNIIEKVGKLTLEICNVDNDTDTNIILGLLHDHNYTSVRVISYK